MDETMNAPQAEKKGGMNMVLIVAAIAVVLIGGFMLFNRPSSQTMTETPVEQPSDSMVENESVMEEVVVVDLEAGAFYYTPNEIRAKKGQTIRINMTAKDMMHDFNIDSLGVKSPVVKAGESVTVEFVASEAGSYEYYCSVGEHRANGQVGTLIVE